MGNKSAHLIRIIVIAVFTFIAYSTSFNSAFHFDDYSSIITHPYIKSINNIPYFFYYNGSPLISRPVTMATFAVNFAIGGLDPFSYHVMNFFIHLANALLVYWLMTLTFKTRYLSNQLVESRYESQLGYSSRNRPTSLRQAAVSYQNNAAHYLPIHLFTYSPLFIALMFAVHPIQTQAVVYIVQRAEILSSFFYLLALVLFIKASRLSREQRAESREQDTEGREQRAEGKEQKTENIKLKLHAPCSMLYAVSIFSAVLAMGSKEIAMTLPVVILLYDFFFLSEGDMKALARRWPVHLLFFLTLIPLVYFMGVSQLTTFVSTDAVQLPPTSIIEAGTSSISRQEYFLTQFRVIWTYIKLLILPINQNLDYNYGLSRGLFTPLTTLFGGIGITALIGLAVFLFKRQRVISFFILWFFLIIAPTSSFAVLPDVIFEHRMYLPSLGGFVIFALGAFRASEIIFRTKRRG